MGNSNNKEIKKLLKSKLNQEVTVQTGAGPVSGVLTFIGDDYIQLVEASSENVIVPMASIEGIL